MRQTLYRRNGILMTRLQAFTGIAHNDIVETLPQRHACGGGECWKCYKDMIEEKFVADPDYRECTCGSTWCAVCAFYQYLTGQLSYEP